MNFFDKIKQKIWRGVYFIFPFLRKAGVLRHKNRQPYLLGWLAPGRNLEELKRHLSGEWGFGNHFVAWVDDGQVLSWRKLVSFEKQYHLRVFNDGEIRGHFEWTPEARPIDHFRSFEEEERKEDFLNFLGDFIVAEKYISNLVPDSGFQDPYSQITFQNTNQNFANSNA